MKKETYTFAQVLLALYKKYADNQAILKELKDYIEVTPSKKIDDINFAPSFEFYDQTPYERYVYHDKLIKLEITEKLDLLKRIKEEFEKRSFSISEYDILQYLRKLYYNVERDENGDYQIKFSVNGELTSINPQISISNQSRFNALVNEIMNSELMSISRQDLYRDRMIGGWEFFMDANYISLCGPEKKFLGIYDIQQKVEFLPHKNTVTISSPGENNYVLDLLYEPIPAFCFDETARKMIERDLPKHDGGIVLENDRVEPYGKNVFNIEQDNNKLKLVRVKSK